MGSLVLGLALVGLWLGLALVGLASLVVVNPCS